MYLSNATLDEHIGNIRNALWRIAKHGSARLIVGAGFSRNAVARRPDAPLFPLWRDLAREMAAAIPADNAADPLWLAEVYVATFGPDNLRKFIETRIPDDDYTPGNLHHQLLKLPWLDVFTTNYDTLLERAAVTLRDGPYDCIYESREVAGKPPRRLVKLHGTVGRAAPLIATREDYRKYPDTHPAFGNLMRQALSESTFVLVGFNGDDPNFNAFWGWVRDCFGSDAPKVYLCGLGIPETQTRLFNAMGITALDLSPVAAQGTPDERHRRALEWLLAALDRKTPHDLRWAPRQAEGLNVGFTAFSEFPAAEWKSIAPEKLSALAAIWRAQRQEYPGWFLAPDEVRQRLWDTTHLWRHAVFHRAEALPAVPRLSLLRECCWRIETALGPIFTQESDQLVGWLEAVNPFGSAVDLSGATVPADAELVAAREAWIGLAFSILRTARDDLDDARFDLWLGRLERVMGSDAGLRGELQHEVVLRELNRLDLPAFRRELARWRSMAKQPCELAQLAGYYAERFDKPAAVELANQALAQLAAQTPATVWLEAWIYMLLSALHWRDPVEKERCDEALERVKLQGYNPWTTVDAFRDELKLAEPPRRPRISYKARFDAGDVRRSVNLGGSAYKVPAFQLLRFLERAPSPIFAGDLVVVAAAAAHAAVWIDTAAPHWTLATLLRAGANAEVVDEMFDRLTVAVCDQAQAEKMCAQLLRLVRSEIELLPDRGDEMGRRMLGTALDVLSRFSLRLRGPALLELLEAIRGWFVAPGVISRHDLASPLKDLLDRVLEAMPDENFGQVIAALLVLPIYGEKNYQPKTHEQMWPEPFDFVWNRDARPPADWVLPADTWQRLLLLIRSDQFVARARAFTRAYYLWLNHWLTPAQGSELSTAVWSQLSPAGLPILSGFRSSVVLHLPDAESHNATALLKAVYLQQVPKSWKTAEGSIDINQLNHNRNWFESLAELFRHEALADERSSILPLTEEEAIQLAKSVLLWWSNVSADIPRRDSISDGYLTIDIERLVAALGALFGEALNLRLPRPHPVVVESTKMFTALWALGYPVLRLLPAQLYLKPTEVNGVVAHLFRSLLSEDSTIIVATTEVVLAWHRGARRAVLPPMPPLILEAIAMRIGLRCGPDLVRLVRCAAFIVEDEGRNCSDSLIELLVLALGEILEVSEPARLKRRLTTGEIDRKHVVEQLHLRSWAALLARKLDAVLTAKGSARPEVLARWQEVRGKAVLPEIRRA